MPYANFGDQIDLNVSRFRKLKSKGDKLVFRILGKPFYEGKHFLKTEEGWNIVPCPRVNEGAKCEYCDKFFKEMARAKKEGLTKKEADKLTRPYRATVSFYFPILNRETQRFEVLQTTMGVRNKIETLIELGADVLKTDLVLLRTEKPGNYYEVTKLDSSEVKPLTDKEKEEVKVAKETNLEEFVNGKQDENSQVNEDLEF